MLFAYTIMSGISIILSVGGISISEMISQRPKERKWLIQSHTTKRWWSEVQFFSNFLPTSFTTLPHCPFVPFLKHPQVALFHCFLTPTTAPWSASRKSPTHADTPTNDSSHSFLVTSSGPPPISVMVSCLAFSSQSTSMITNLHAPLQRTHLWTLYLALATMSYCLPSLIKFLKNKKKQGSS